MFGKYFEYNGHKSTDFGLMIGGVNVSSEVPFAMSRDIYAGTLNRYKNKVNQMGTKWSNVLQFDLSFVKDVCVNQSELVFSEDEVNNINAWLTSPDFPLLFHMYDFDETVPSNYDSVYLRKDLLVNSGNNRLIVEAPGENFIIGGENKIIPVNVLIEFLFTSSGQFVVSHMMFELSAEQVQYMEEHDDAEIAYPEYEDPVSIEVKDNYIRMMFNPGQGKLLSNAVYTLNETSLPISQSMFWSYQTDDTCRVLIGRELSWNHKYDYFGLFSNVTAQTISGEVVGFNATFLTNSPFAWTEEKVVSHEMSSSESEDITFTVNSPEWERELYPLIEIVGVDSNTFNYDPETGEYTGSASARETITITNNNDTSTSYDENYRPVITPRSITLEVPHAPVYLDSERGKIYDIVTVASEDINRILDFEDLGLSDLSHIYWPRLFNGENNWTITGNCKIKIKYREPRKVGAY